MQEIMDDMTQAIIDAEATLAKSRRKLERNMGVRAYKPKADLDIDQHTRNKAKRRRRKLRNRA